VRALAVQVLAFGGLKFFPRRVNSIGDFPRQGHASIRCQERSCEGAPSCFRSVDRPPVRGQNDSMSVIEDVRQIVQDFLAPELRAIAVQMEALNRRMDNLESNIGIQFSAAKTEAASRQEVVLLQIEHIKNLLDVDKRLLRLESQSTGVLGKNA